MYMKLRVGLREGKTGRPPRRLSVVRFEAAVHAGGAVEVRYNGPWGAQYWAVRVAYAPGVLADLERFVKAGREGSHVRIPSLVATEGPTCQVRVDRRRRNLQRRRYADALELTHGELNIQARWFDGGTCFEMVADASGWRNFFDEIRARTPAGTLDPKQAPVEQPAAHICKHGREGATCGYCRRKVPSAQRAAARVKPEAVPARPTEADLRAEFEAMLAANASETRPCPDPHACVQNSAPSEGAQ